MEEKSSGKERKDLGKRDGEKSKQEGEDTGSVRKNANSYKRFGLFRFACDPLCLPLCGMCVSVFYAHAWSPTVMVVQSSVEKVIYSVYVICHYRCLYLYLLSTVLITMPSLIHCTFVVTVFVWYRNVAGCVYDAYAINSNNPYCSICN